MPLNLTRDACTVPSFIFQIQSNQIKLLRTLQRQMSFERRHTQPPSTSTSTSTSASFLRQIIDQPKGSLVLCGKAKQSKANPSHDDTWSLSAPPKTPSLSPPPHLSLCVPLSHELRCLLCLRRISMSM